jgi:hypothetical protein
MRVGGSINIKFKQKRDTKESYHNNTWVNSTI